MYRNTIRSVAAAVLAGMPLAPAVAAVTISSAATQNMNCTSGVCTPTANDAVLNVSDLENLLAAGNLVVTTTGAGAVQAGDVDVTAPFSWSSVSVLSLDSYESLTIGGTISVAGSSGLSIVTNDGGSGGLFSITRNGHIVFQNLSSQLTINGVAYVLVNSIASLQSAINNNIFGSFALAGLYDASGDGTYTGCAVGPQNTLGTFDGLGNTISNVSIQVPASGYFWGFFCVNPGTIEHFRLQDVEIAGVQTDGDVGILAGFSGGYLYEDFAAGKIRARGRRVTAGGLVGAINPNNAGTSIDHCFSDVRIDGRRTHHGFVGGLVGYDSSTPIYQSISTGPVMAGNLAQAGGLVGWNDGGTIENSYATGAVSGGLKSKVGGLIGRQGSLHAEEVDTSYSTGAVTGGQSSLVGGFVGTSSNTSSYNYAYWDTTSSGTNQAAGRGKSTGMEGLTTQQLQAGLPSGFDPTIWPEDANINGGLPYLISNPPRK